ncbi:MAG: oxidoreductase [Alphaproteobacteria bacterium]|nr:oxidoreductase [Alphaproteobacteria bacterium]
MAKFNALVLRQEDGKVGAAVEQVDESELPEGDVLVRVEYSTVNYKDGMILGGLGGFTRNFPHVPGIDFAGTVEHSNDPALKPGDKVVQNGWRMGENRWGGYAQKARVKAGQLVKLPNTIDTKRAMAIGTAGYTAMLAINRLERHGLKPGDGTVLVTGAAGGVGSVSIALLAKLGYQVAASTGRPEQGDYLRKLGATEIVERSELSADPSKPLDAERWAACVDSVGGTTLSTVLTQIKYRGAIAACGLAGGREFSTSVLPFLLRGVALLGIDSVMCPMPERLEAWERLGRVLPLDLLDSMTEHATLEDLPRLGGDILAGQVRGRMVIDVNG